MRSLSKRKRKKYHIGEFCHYGLLLKFKATEVEFDEVNDIVEGYCDKHKFYLWGGGYSQMTLQHVRKSYNVPMAAVWVIRGVASEMGVQPTYVLYNPKKRDYTEEEWTAIKEELNSITNGKLVSATRLDIYANAIPKIS